MDLVKHEQDEEQQAFLPNSREDNPSSEGGSRKAKSASKSYLRLILEILMAFTIVILFIRPFPDRRRLKPSPVPNSTFFTCDLKAKEDCCC